MKPTSWCIDIRQEHSLLEKFKERFNVKSSQKCPDLMYPMRDFSYGRFNRRIVDSKQFRFITLDERRERRGKEYYENNLNNLIKDE